MTSCDMLMHKETCGHTEGGGGGVDILFFLRGLRNNQLLLFV